MTPDEFSKLLARDEYLVLDIPPEEFQSLEKCIGVRSYTYRPSIEKLTIKMCTPMHAMVICWAGELIAEGVAQQAFDRGDLTQISKERMTRFVGEYQDIIKSPDVALVPSGRYRPTIVFEFGYAEPYGQLKAETTLLLEGTQGSITKVVIIKLDPLAAGETKIKKGFVEVWHLVDGKVKQEGRRKKLFPVPESHAQQMLKFRLRDILRNKFFDLVNPGWGKSDTLDLHFDGLRKVIMEATVRHLINKGVLPVPQEEDEGDENEGEGRGGDESGGGGGGGGTGEGGAEEAEESQEIQHLELPILPVRLNTSSGETKPASMITM
ncbi:unnamed protein product [Tuber aestivum]|uniref:Uncharacterized protein n=1 Tax=Tuber aestivum TaxID=59557 RepID=A0A292PJT9_9PEZI|nr:unnamed protein product [Tuber aestivum]